jgi:hypothetical protein
MPLLPIRSRAPAREEVLAAPDQVELVRAYKPTLGGQAKKIKRIRAV